MRFPLLRCREPIVLHGGAFLSKLQNLGLGSCSRKFQRPVVRIGYTLCRRSIAALGAAILPTRPNWISSDLDDRQERNVRATQPRLRMLLSKLKSNGVGGPRKLGSAEIGGCEDSQHPILAIG